MADPRFSYYNDQELASAEFDWSSAGEDFSTGWTFSVRLCDAAAPTTTVLLKTTGITSTATTVTVAWSTSDWSGLTAATRGTDYVLYLYARRTSDSKDLAFNPGRPTTLKLYAAAGTSAVSPDSHPITVTAASVTLADTGGYFAATNVEDALAEVFATPSTTTRRVVELATDAETLALGDTQRVVTPSNLNAYDGQLWPWFGYDVLPRDLATGTTLVTLTKNTLFFRTFVAPADMVVTGVQMASTATVSAGLTLARFCLGQVAPETGDSAYTEARYTLLARTDSDTTMFNTANTLVSRDFSATGGWPTSVRLIRGQRYFVGYMIVGTTAPTVVSAAALMRPQINSASTTQPLIGGQPTGIEAHTDLPPFWNGTQANYDGTGAAPWYGLKTNPTSTLARPVDTIVVGDSYANSAIGWASVGNAVSGSKLHVSLWAGYSGQQTDYVLGQIATTTGKLPELVIVSCGINDVANGISAAVVEANLTSIATALTAAGAKVIICTIPPNTSMDAGKLVTLAAVNTWLKSTFSMANVWVSDTGMALTTGDGVTRNASLYTDGAHPNFAGCAAMGAVLGATITTATA